MRSSCEAFAMNSRRAWSSAASRSRIRSKVRASWPTSSVPWSTIGSSNSPGRDPLGRGLEPPQAAGEQQSAEISDRKRRDERKRARHQQPVADEIDRLQRLVQGRRDEQHRVRRGNGDRRLRKAPAAAVGRPVGALPPLGGLQRDRIPLDVGRVDALRVARDDQSGRWADRVVDDDARVGAVRCRLEEIGPVEPVGRAARARFPAQPRPSWESRECVRRLSSEGTTIR